MDGMMTTITRERLDEMDARLRDCLVLTTGPEATELIRLCRLGLWAKEKAIPTLQRRQMSDDTCGHPFDEDIGDALNALPPEFNNATNKGEG